MQKHRERIHASNYSIIALIMMYPTSSEGLNKETDKAVYFFTSAFYSLDNFSAHSISIWNQKFPTAEHAYQWKKFSVTAPAVAEAILSSGSPEAALVISIANKVQTPSDWNEDRLRIMEEIIRA